MKKNGASIKVYCNWISINILKEELILKEESTLQWIKHDIAWGFRDYEDKMQNPVLNFYYCKRKKEEGKMRTW